jgi:hypothetical protein
MCLQHCFLEWVVYVVYRDEVWSARLIFSCLCIVQPYLSFLRTEDALCLKKDYRGLAIKLYLANSMNQIYTPFHKFTFES